MTCAVDQAARGPACSLGKCHVSWPPSTPSEQTMTKLTIKMGPNQADQKIDHGFG